MGTNDRVPIRISDVPIPRRRNGGGPGRGCSAYLWGRGRQQRDVSVEAWDHPDQKRYPERVEGARKNRDIRHPTGKGPLVIPGGGSSTPRQEAGGESLSMKGITHAKNSPGLSHGDQAIIA